LAINDQNQINSSIAKITRDLIESDMSIQDSIARNYVNISGVARLLKPKIEKISKTNVNEEAIITAIKRITPKYNSVSNEIMEIISKSSINVRTGVSKLSVVKNKRNQEKIRNAMINNKEEFIQISEATSALTVIYSQEFRKELTRRFNNAEILEDSVNLAAIIVHSPIEVINIPGFVFTIYGQVAKRQINIEDTVSCFTDTIIVVKTKDVAMTFSALNELFEFTSKLE
tara:strand:- start:2774 stop:3460 length:687 start_codon:yes stop_codon:yes gene_type:complete